MSDAPRLRIALEATSLLGAKTGVGTMTGELLRRLATIDDLELRALLVSWRGRGLLEAELPAGVSCDAVAFPARLAHRLWSRVDYPRLRGFDLVHGPNFVVPPSPGAVELVTIHDFGPWHFPELVTSHAGAYPALVDRAVSRGADVHVVSDFVAEEAVELLGIERERVHVIHNGFGGSISVGDGERARDEIGGRYVLTLGTIEPRKDLPTLVRAMTRVWEDVADLRLVVAGADGWGTEAFEAALDDASIARPDVRRRVIRLGYVSDRQRANLLAGAVALAFPSRYEGFGLPPLEAMAEGCPVITTTAGALPEVCGDAARFVTVGDDAALAEAIVTVATDDSVAETLVASGRANLDRFSWDRAATEMADLYRSLAR